jgi:predicted protein tyrosine phosphatase
MTRLSGYDFMNLVMAFDRSLEILIDDIEKKDKATAIKRANDMRNAIAKLKGHVDAKDCPVHLHKGHGPHAAIV